MNPIILSYRSWVADVAVGIAALRLNLTDTLSDLEGVLSLENLSDAERAEAVALYGRLGDLEAALRRFLGC